MTTARTSGQSLQNRQSESDLDCRYGRIAISAVVAALPYCSEAKNPDAPAEARDSRAA